MDKKLRQPISQKQNEFTVTAKIFAINLKLILLSICFFGWASLAFANADEEELTFCTMDVKACPDGSYVSRSGPRCEFALCPSEKLKEVLITTTITGSAETPDPVLEKVRELEQKGLVTHVVIMESFPVRIQFQATQKIIDLLQALPRKTSEECH
jgi:hypothetical protein